MENKFTNGLIFGGLLMVVTAVIFGMSKEGRQLTKKLKKDFNQMTMHAKENLGTLRDVTKEDFDELIITLVEEYGSKKKINDDSKKKIIKELKSKWEEIKEEYENKVS